MKKFAVLVCLMAGVFISLSFGYSNPNPSKDKLLIEIVSYVLSRGHFAPAEINDSFSENVYMNYLNSLDGRHQFFLKADINNFNIYKKKIDDQIKASKVDFFNVSYKKFMKRMAQVKSFYPSLLETPFDFTEKESIDLDYENVPYAESLSELKKVWRKFLKFNGLSIYSGLV
jgi:carboxyl-terminal processing protease